MAYNRSTRMRPTKDALMPTSVRMRWRGDWDSNRETGRHATDFHCTPTKEIPQTTGYTRISSDFLASSRQGTGQSAPWCWCCSELRFRFDGVRHSHVGGQVLYLLKQLTERAGEGEAYTAAVGFR